MFVVPPVLTLRPPRCRWSTSSNPPEAGAAGGSANCDCTLPSFSWSRHPLGPCSGENVIAGAQGDVTGSTSEESSEPRATSLRTTRSSRTL